MKWNEMKWNEMKWNEMRRIMNINDVYLDLNANSFTSRIRSTR